MALLQKLTSAYIALIAKTKYDIMNAHSTLTSLKHLRRNLMKSIEQ